MSLFVVSNTRMIVAVVAVLWLLPNPLRSSSIEHERQVKMVVGDIVVTNYIYERELEKLRKKVGFLTDQDELKWRDDWINRLKITCLARAQGYDDDPNVVFANEVLGSYMLLENSEGPYANYLLSESDLDGLSVRERRRLLGEVLENEKRLILGEALRVDEPHVSSCFVESVVMREGSIELVSEDVSDRVLFRCLEGGDEVEVSIREFVDHYNKKVFREPLDSVSRLRDEMDDYVVMRYRKLKARELGLDREWRFVRERESFVNNTIYNVYLSEVIRPSIVLSDRDIELYYRREIEDFRTYREIDVVEMRSFSMGELYALRRRVLQLNGEGRANMSQWVEAMPMVEELTLHVDNESYGGYKRLGLFDVQIGELTRVNERDGGGLSVCLVLEGRGAFVPPLSIVRPEVEERLSILMLSKAVGSKLREIEGLYQVDVFSEGDR